MKKLLLGITGVSLLLIFTLASCENGTNSTDLSTKTTLQTLAAPTNVKATAFGETGVIRVTWDPVVNATGYSVYRKSVAPSNQGGETQWVYLKTTIGGTVTSPAFLGIEDVIDFTNEFKPDVTYTYKVAALTNWSSASTKVSGDPWDASNNTVLQNSSADSNGVKFDAPPTDPKKKPKNPLTAAGEQLAAPEFTVESVKSYKVYSSSDVQEKLLVSWDTKPGLTYLVYYSYGSDYLIIDSQFVDQPAIVAGQTKATSTFPLINGNTNIQLVAQHKTGYYLDSEPVAVKYTGAQTVLTPVNLTATRNGKVVLLTWTDDYPGATYQVYRFTSKTTSYATGGYIFEDWKEITADIKAFNKGGSWQGADLDLNEENQSYVYMLIATLGDAKTIPTTVSVDAENNGISAPTPVITNLGWDGDNKKFKGVQISWTSVFGQTYKLSRKAVLLDDDGVNVIGPKTGTWDSDWVDVPGVPATIPTPNNTGANMGLIDEPTVKDAYMYRLVTTQGSLKPIEKFAELKGGAYSNTVSVGLSLSNSPTIAPNTAADTTAGWATDKKNKGTAYTVGITLSGNKDQLKALLGSDTVKIFRAKYNNDPNLTPGYQDELGTYQEVTFAQADFLAQKQVIDGPLDPGYYKYKAVVVSGGNQLKNPAANSSIVSASYTKAYPIYQASGTNKGKFVANGSSKDEYIQGQTLYLKTIDATSYPTDNTAWNDATAVSFGKFVRTNTKDNPDEYTTNAVSSTGIPTGSSRYVKLYAVKEDGTHDEIGSATVTP